MNTQSRQNFSYTKHIIPFDMWPFQLVWRHRPMTTFTQNQRLLTQTSQAANVIINEERKTDTVHKPLNKKGPREKQGSPERALL